MGTKQYKPKDFDPRPEYSVRDENPDALAARFAAFASRHNAQLEKN